MQQALFKLGQWPKKAQKYFPNSGKTIIRWLDEIIAYFDNRTTSGVVEGINNKLKLIKPSAYGFRNFENYKNRCLLTWLFNCYFSIVSKKEPSFISNWNFNSPI
ncbi:ISL3 family transposase [Microcoleus sp. AR_TQ3_B6]|uniref:ISL3 family transposase n=1 Tax=Microcoleus sp. AR_TQ3_B6 TaxID=3055284 RepID=UPI00403F341F